MRKAVQLPMNIDKKPLEKISRYLFRKKVTAIAIASLSALLLAALVVIHLNSPITIPYEEVAESIEIDVSDDGKVYVTMDNKGGSNDVEYVQDEDGVMVQHISIYTTKWNQLRKTAGSSTFFMTDNDADNPNPVRRIYYYPSEQTGEAVCLYEAPELAGKRNGGVIVLPRLTLNYYILLAALLTCIGAVCCLLNKKEKSRLFVALKITLFPFMYFVSSIVILWNAGDIYNASYYFTGILITTIILYILGYWLLEYFHYRSFNK